MVAHLVNQYGMDMNRRNDLDQTPFMFYLKWNKHAKLLYFCQFKKIYDLDFDIVDKEGYTILHWAVSNWKGKCKADIVEFVLNNGGQKYMHAKTNDGKTVCVCLYRPVYCAIIYQLLCFAIYSGQGCVEWIG